MSDFFHKNMIIDYFKSIISQNFGFVPTREQEEVIDSLARFVLQCTEEEAQSAAYFHRSLFLLRGYAGTGKTSLIGALVKTMIMLERQCVLLAPTGRAAKVFSLYASHPAYTIHKRIYRQKSIEIDSPFSLDFNSMKHTLFIVDEASIINNEASMDLYDSSGVQRHTFNRGMLLDDLLEFVYSGEGCRLIVLGDTAQLPPVGAMESPALQPEILSGYGYNVIHHTLTQVVRQTEESNILTNATTLRSMISDGITEGIRPEIQFGHDVVNVTGNELIETLSHCYHEYGTDDTIVICRSNKRANIYNNGIRTQILDRESELSSGDIIMIAKNNYYWLSRSNSAEEAIRHTETNTGEDPHGNTAAYSAPFLANGDIARVNRVRNEREFYGFRFADVELTLPDYDDMEIEATVLLDTLHSESPSLTREQSELLYNRILEDYMDIPHKHERLKKLKEDPYYNALQIKYAYAVTCHKAQGGQWSQVFIDEGYITPDMIGIDYYRWLYTAVTRATDKIYLVNWKKSE